MMNKTPSPRSSTFCEMPAGKGLPAATRAPNCAPMITVGTGLPAGKDDDAQHSGQGLRTHLSKRRARGCPQAK